ncbi:MAG: UDP-3-O-(3-hydroxymyristoyl)glucosamine N-acyltransferase, partial [Gammaproteobacteria bacterium]|nr:UDP-3-O-(3-hydroxymyristoyl)glucosamine N-acyltransferase [Gammaproteobacteria bacterium]
MGEQQTFTLGALADTLSARLVGDADLTITGLGSLGSARPGELSHLSNAAYRDQLAATRASAVILAERDLEAWNGPALVVANPYLTFARATQLFARLPSLETGIHPSAVVDESAEVAADARLGPGVVVGPGSHIGASARLYANVVVGAGCSIDEDCVVMANAVIYDDVRLGPRCTV